MDLRTPTTGLSSTSPCQAAEQREPERPEDQGLVDLPLPFLAAVLTAAVATVLWVWRSDRVVQGLGDTDDALRLVLVRDLMSGRAGWWEQHLTRLQPPVGMDLHWSRLVDAGIASMEWLFRLFLDPGQAEIAVRTFWPMLWLLPAIAAALAIARSLRGPSATFLCALLAMVDVTLYVQWAPGRIDHHDIQITLCLVALAGVLKGSRRGCGLAGVATGLGLAVGIEALIFHAIIGAGVAVRFLFDPMRQRQGARAYAIGLTSTILAAFLIQTPPWRWGVPVCDALGTNLVAAVALGGAGLLVSTILAAREPLATRAVGLAATGLTAGAVYVGLLPVCLHGPLGQADPRLGAVWLNNVAEMQSMFHGFPSLKNSYKLSEVLFHGLAVLSWLYLGRRRTERSFGWMLLGVCLIAAIAAEAGAMRMSFYAAWIAMPVVAAAVADFGARWRGRRRLVPMALMAIAASPCWTSAVVQALDERLHPASAPEPAASADCSEPAAYQTLAKLPTGLVLSDVDLGPYVLATTPHSVVSAPYHRMAWGILSGAAALSAPPGQDEVLARRLHVTYVVTCPASPSRWRKGLSDESLLARLDKGRPPNWLGRLSAPNARLQIYRLSAPPRVERPSLLQ